MERLNDNSSTGEEINSQPTGWESVAKMAGKMNTEEQVAKLKEMSAEIKQGPKHNSELQEIYDSVIGANLEDWEAQWEMQNRFQEFNMSAETPFLASGQSSYFNEQIDQSGMSGLKLREQDVDDARFIAECFGKKASFSDDNLDILYTTLPGTTEMNYATQTFPAIIFEDVFQCSAGHELPFSPKVGEKEEDYWTRVLDTKIAENEGFPQDKIEEVRERGMRLAKNFCAGKNRIYLIPIKDVLANKASFGDIMGVRGGEFRDGETTDDVMDEVLDLEELCAAYGRDANNVSELYGDPNFLSEYGIVIYGKIPQENIQYIEVERGYDIMQRKAKQKGLKDGEEINLSEQPLFS